ncbi:MAG: vWA domain-containing protein [Hyphomicrobium sp.]
MRTPDPVSPSPFSLTEWKNDCRGTTAITFGLAVLPLLFAIGLAVDSARAHRTSGQVSAALDVAALAAAKALRLQGLNDTQLIEIAKNYFNANLETQGIHGASLGELNMTADHATSAITLRVAAALPTTIGKLMSYDRFDMPLQSTAIFDSKDVELSVMLDVSGSMGGGKISDLKNAAKELTKMVLAANAGGAKNKIGIAPFSTAVNAGSYSSPAKGGGADKNTCVTERPGKFAFTDEHPGKGPMGKKSGWCPVVSVTPLTDNVNTLENTIDTMQAEGGTAGHLGIAWAWYVISPDWANFWPPESAPKAYGDPNTSKTAILMTDGMFNREYETGNGKSIDQASKLCDGMKAAGITVYTVGFEAPPEVLPLLQQCASSPTHFFDARNGEELMSTFKDIANRLTSLRLSG